MKKLTAIFLALMLLAGVCCAAAETIHHVPVMNMHLALPEEFLLFTPDTSEEAYAAYGMTKSGIVEFMEANDTYAIILPSDFAYEIDVSMAANTIETFNDVDDDTLISMIDAIGAELETMGVVYDSGKFFHNGQDKYLVLFYHVPGEAYDTYAVQYYTVQNNQAYNFRLFTYGVQATAEQLAALENIMRGVTID